MPKNTMYIFDIYSKIKDNKVFNKVRKDLKKMATDISKTQNVQADMLKQVQDWMKEKDGLASGLADISKGDFTLWGTETYNNGGQKAIDDIDKQIKNINDEIEKWEAKLKEYETELAKINKEIGETGDKIGDISMDIIGRQNKYEKQLQSAISQAITDAVDKTKRNRQAGVNTTFKETFNASLDSLMSGDSSLADIAKLYQDMGNENSTLNKYMVDIDRCISDSDNAMKGLKNASAIINVLNQQKGNMTAQNNNYYSNANNDSKVPVFTYEKETKIAELADKYGIDLNDRNDNNQVTNDGKAATRNDGNIGNITQQIKDLAGNTTHGSGDQYAYGKDNTMMQALETALFGDKKDATTIQEGSLVWQLAENGATNTEIMGILANAFGGVGIKDNGDGKYTVPYGHGTAEERAAGGRTITGRAPEIYTAVMSIANNTAGTPEVSTVAANEKDMANAMKLVDELAAGNFSFKESMYVLDQFFPGLDIGYSLGEQKDFKNGQGGVRFNSDPSYTPLAEKIKGYTGKGGKWENSEVIQSTKSKQDDGNGANRSDPISIKNGDSRLYFMADDGNGKYDGITDLLGSDNDEGMAGFRTKYGIPEGQNVIEGEEALSGIMMMQLKEIDNGDGTVSVQQSFISAWDAGITKIDLTPTNNEDSYNINNTQVQTTFNVTMNGNNFTAEQAMEDDDYIAATLENDAVMGTNMFSQLSEADVEKAYNDPLNDKMQSVYDLAEKIHTQATELKEKNGGNGDILIDKDEEKAFNDRIKQELNDAADLAKAVGGATFGEGSLEGVDTPDEDNYNNEGEYSGWFNDKGEGLDEAINDTVIDEMKKKGYETYGDQK